MCRSSAANESIPMTKERREMAWLDDVTHGIPMESLQIVPLKDVNFVDTSSSFPFDVEQPTATRRVCFHDTVSVVPIPSLDAYPEEIRSTLWRSRYELAAMVARNMVEFASEGFDWENVVEEQDMLHIEGEVIHPAHLYPIVLQSFAQQAPVFAVDDTASSASSSSSSQQRRRSPMLESIPEHVNEEEDVPDMSEVSEDEVSLRIDGYFGRSASPMLMMDRPSSPFDSTSFEYLYEPRPEPRMLPFHMAHHMVSFDEEETQDQKVRPIAVPALRPQAMLR